MKTTELLQLQALKLKQELFQQDPLTDVDESAPAWKTAVYDVAGESRNVCAMLPLPLFEEVQRLSGLLSISKRRIIEMALCDFAETANKALSDVGFLPSSMTSRVLGDVPVDQS